MLQEIFCTLLLLCGSFYATCFSGVYIAFALYIWVSLILGYNAPKAIFKFLMLISLLVILLKSSLIFVIYYKEFNIIQVNENTFLTRGLFLDEAAMELWLFKNFGFDIFALIISIIGSKYGYHSKFSRKLGLYGFRYQVMQIFEWVGLALLCVECVIYFSVISFIYSLLAITIGINLRYKSNTAGKIICILVSSFSLIQIIFSYLYKVILHQWIGDDIVWGLGLITWDQKMLTVYVTAFALQWLYTYLGFVKMNKFQMKKMMRAPLILVNDGIISQSHGSAFLDYTWKETGLHLIARLFAILWTIYFKNVLSMTIMIPLFLSIIISHKKIILALYRVILIPLLFGGFSFSYVKNLYMNDNSYLRKGEIAFLIITLMCFIILVRLEYRKHRKKFRPSRLSFLLKWWYSISLLCILLVGLSQVDIAHGLIVLSYFVFLMMDALIPKYWIYLTVYSMGYLFLIKTLNVFPEILMSSFVSSTTDASTIGILTEEFNRTIYWNEVLMWALVIFQGIQLWINKTRQKLLYRTRLFTQSLNDQKKHALYVWYKGVELWFIFVLIFAFILMSAKNFINFVRFILACVLVIDHLKKPVKYYTKDFTGVLYITFVFKILSGIILIGRYLYQYFPLFSLPTTNSLFIGIEIYDTTDLYTTAILDSCLYIASRYSYRLLKVQKAKVIHYLFDYSKYYKYWVIFESHHFFLLLVIFVLSVYWKLSLSMFLYLFIAIIYFISICIYFNNVTDRDYEVELRYRRRLWRALFTITISSFIVSYINVLLEPTFFQPDINLYLEWTFFIIGFTKTTNWSILDNYGYFIICIFLIMEKHCLEYLTPKTEEEHLLKAKEQELAEEGVKKKVNAVFIVTLNLIIIISESVIPMMLLFIAFDKLTIISGIYLLTLFFISAFSKDNQKLVFCMTLSIMVLVQYILILSNINKKNSPQTPPSIVQFDEPWYLKQDWITMDDPFFLNLGSDISQLHSILLDQICILLCMLHFILLVTYKSDRKLYDSNLQQNQENNEKSEKLEDSEKYEKLKKPEDSHENEGNTLQKTWGFIKRQVYKFSRYLFLFFVLLFTSQSLGLISLIYCIFALLFILKEIDLIESIENLKKYIKLLAYFLLFVLLDLIVQFVFQMPFKIFQEYGENNLFQVVGVLKLWRAGSNSFDPSHRAWTYINLKISVFAVICLIYRMIKSEEFNKYFDEQLKEQNSQSKELGILKAKKFNDDRIDRFKDYERSRFTFKNELNELEKHLEMLRLKDKELGQKKGKDYKEFLNTPKLIPKSTDEKQDKPLKVHIDNLLIRLVDPILFKDYLQEIEKRDKVQPPNLELTNLDEEINRRVYKRSKTEMHQPIIGEIKLFEENNPAIKDYRLILGDYLRLLFMYIPSSNTQNLVFILCFINHYNYASLESVILPLSVVGYAMFEYPRPPPLYFKTLQYYCSGVFLIKYCIQLEIWPYITQNKFPKEYHDPFKTGFNLASNTHSENLFYYTIWDTLLMIMILFHLYYLRRVGLFSQSEYDIETFEQAKDRKEKEKSLSRNTLENLVMEPQDSFLEPHPSCIKRFFKTIERFFARLIPSNKEEKPGKDFYFPIIFTQLVILIYIFFTFTKMEGYSQDISQSIRANQFQGRMVIALIVQFSLILLDRYLYVRKTSQALKENLEASEDSDKESLDPEDPFFQKSRSATVFPTDSATHRTELKKRLSFLTREQLDSDDELEDFERSLDEPQQPTSVEKRHRRKWNKDLLLKVLLHFLIMLLVHVLVFWYFPISGTYSLTGKVYCPDNNSANCNDFQVNDFIEWFYIIYAVYFMIVSLQIRHGLPTFRKVSFPLMRSTNIWSYRMFKTYLALPFLFELRTLMDWTFTKTTLDIYQWFKFEDIYNQLYITQCVYKWYEVPQKDQPIHWTWKVFNGAFVIIVICLVILAPLIIFSTLNPIVESNQVRYMNMEISINTDDRTYLLYNTKTLDESHFITEEEWTSYEFNDVKEVQSSDIDRMQIISLPLFQETYWQITPPSKERLCKSLNDTANYQGSSIEMTLVFYRRYPYGQTRVSQTIRAPLFRKTRIFYDMICNEAYNATEFTYDNFYGKIIRLPSAGTFITPEPIAVKGFTSDLIIRLHTYKADLSYWEVGSTGQDFKTIGLKFFMISDHYSPATFNFSVLTFYISVVYLVARFLRYFVTGGSKNIYVTDMKNAGPLITLCSGIYVSRMRGDLIREEELYYELIDILRSPELVRMMTGKLSIKLKKD
ncbi:unnamed protein product [Blepharisma stoltei]|uniref:Piezo-type mechanosensitive ion channel component n=1 Tax=Blepharisma stoltei TaxID=1481888 RepID=A0AAU9IEM1_9CILI|nr:unnamed protein product [Blepharisma stoltei]